MGYGQCHHPPRKPFYLLMKLADQACTFTRTIKRELRVYQCVLRDPRTPWYAKAVLGLAVGYLLMPFDLIPDFIPVLGQLDDILIVPGLVWLALKLIPPEIVGECRTQVMDER
jgi:uncharacterized membrane protein YkvA (DUF1232 family)